MRKPVRVHPNCDVFAYSKANAHGFNLGIESLFSHKLFGIQRQISKSHMTHHRVKSCVGPLFGDVDLLVLTQVAEVNENHGNALNLLAIYSLSACDRDLIFYGSLFSGTMEKLQKNRQKPISIEQGEKLAKELKAVKYVECSALTQVCTSL